MTGCTSQAPVDQVGLYYTGGMFQGNHFKRLVQPGSGAQFRGWQDHIHYLPAGQRNYIVSKHGSEGDRKGLDIIQVPAKGVLMDFEVSVYFKLNTSSAVIRQFYEQICKKYSCDDNGGEHWSQMLNDNLRKIIETSMQETVRPYDVGELYANQAGASGGNDSLTKVQTEVGQSLKDRVNSVLGGEFFCGPKFDRNKPECPPLDFIINSAEPTDQAVKDSFTRIRSSVNGIQEATNNGLALQEQAKGEAAKQNALKTAGELSPNQIAYLNAQANLACAQNKDGHCVLVVGGGNVQVSTAK
jgi:hypothetical protein